jgi:hypothetical protein
MRETQ